MVLIKFADFVQILLQLHFIQAAGFIQESNGGPAARLHLFAQHLCAKMRVSFEINSAHRASDSFIDSVNYARCPAFLVDWIYSKLNADVSEAAPLINFYDFLPGFFQLLFVDRLVQFQFDFFAQSLCFHAFGAVDYDLAKDRTRLHSNDHP